MFPEMHMRVPAVILVQHFKYLLSGIYFVFLRLFSHICFLSKLDNRSRGVISGGPVGQSHFKMMQTVKNSFFGVLAV